MPPIYDWWFLTLERKKHERLYLADLLNILEHRNLFKSLFASYAMNKWLEILVGLILIIVPILVVTQVFGAWGASWWTATKFFIKGGIIVFVVLIGLLFLMLGISDLKE